MVMEFIRKCTIYSRFKAVWDDRENEYGCLMKYEILYFLADDTVMVKEIHEKNDGRDPYPILLRKTKLPKVGDILFTELFVR